MRKRTIVIQRQWKFITGLQCIADLMRQKKMGSELVKNLSKLLNETATQRKLIALKNGLLMQRKFIIVLQ